MKFHCAMALLVLISTWQSLRAAERPPAQASKPEPSLFERIEALDTASFDAFNRCSDPQQLHKHADYFATDVEFYHDKGGVTWTREQMIENTRKFVCGKFRRELVPDTLTVFPVFGFGAIAHGTHRFCPFDSDRCDGKAQFSMVWRHADGDWKITRVLSYAHAPNQ